MLRQFCSPQTSRETFAYRLTRLTRAQYLHRPEQQRHNYNANYSFLIYALTPKGLEALVAAGEITEQDITWRKALLRAKRLEFWHDLNLANTVLSIRLGLQSEYMGPFAIIDHPKVPETTRLGPKPFTFALPDQKLTPDYMFAVKRNGQWDRFLLENDEATEALTRTGAGSSLLGKLELYDRLISRGTIQKQFRFSSKPYVLVTTRTQARVTTIKKLIEGFSNRECFLFRVIPKNEFDFVPKPDPSLAHQPWQRSGHQDFYLEEGGVSGSQT